MSLQSLFFCHWIPNRGFVKVHYCAYRTIFIHYVVNISTEFLWFTSLTELSREMCIDDI